MGVSANVKWGGGMCVTLQTNLRRKPGSPHHHGIFFNHPHLLSLHLIKTTLFRVIPLISKEEIALRDPLPSPLSISPGIWRGRGKRNQCQRLAGQPVVFINLSPQPSALMLLFWYILGKLGMLQFLSAFLQAFSRQLLVAHHPLAEPCPLQINTSASHTVSKRPSGSQGVSCFVVVFNIHFSTPCVFLILEFFQSSWERGVNLLWSYIILSAILRYVLY